MAFSRAVISFFVNAESAKKQIADFKGTIKQTATDISQTFIGKFGGIAAIGGGVKALADIYTQTKKLADFSNTFSLPVEEVSRFSNVLSMFGGSTDESINDLKQLQQAITDFKTTGGGALRAVSAQVGLSLTNADGSMKNSMQVIDDLRAKFKGLSQSAQLKVAQELGLASPSTLQMLRASDDEYGKIRKQAEQMNVVNQGTADKVTQLSRLLATLKQQWYGVGTIILDFVLKPLEQVGNALAWFNNQSETTRKLFIGISGALLLFKPAIDIIMFLKAGIVGLIAPLKLVFGLLAANPILATIGAIALGIVYFDEIKEAMDNFLASGTPFANFCKGIVENINLILTPIKMAGEAIGWLAAKFSGGVKKPIEELTDEEYAKQEGVSVERAREVRKNRQMFIAQGAGEASAVPADFTGQLKGAGEVSAMQNAQIVSATTVNNSATTATTNNKNSTVNQTFNFNGTSDEMRDKLVSIVKQGATGVR